MASEQMTIFESNQLRDAILPPEAAALVVAELNDVIRWGNAGRGWNATKIACEILESSQVENSLAISDDNR